MGGRGRGRGGGRPNTTFTQEQSTSMGLTKGGSNKEMMGPTTLVLPPDFPIMANKPTPLKLDIKGEYLITIKKELVTRLRETGASMVCTSNKTENKYADILSGKPDNPMHDFPWSHVPTELKPNFKRKAIALENKEAKRSRNIDINSRLAQLERKEAKEGTGNNAVGNEDNVEKEETEETEYVEEEQPDEEMDMETDYVNDYFDNGEGFDDEDDQLDEPVF